MSLSPSSPQEEAISDSLSAAPREIPDSNPSSSASSPAEALNSFPSAPSSEEASKPDLPVSSPPASSHIDPTQASTKPASQEIQDTGLLPPPPNSPLPPAPPINPQEAKKTATLKAKITALETQIHETAQQQKEVDAKLKTKDPKATVKAHIKLLHDYNEIRDVGQGLMGIIADNRGVRVIDVYEEFGVGEGD